MDELAISVRGDLAQEAAAALAEAEAAIAELEQLDDTESLARAWRAVIEIRFVRADYGLVGEASSHLLECARLTGIRREEVWAVRGLAAALTYGPTPVEEAIPRVERALAAFPQERAGEDHPALLYAFAGRFDDAEQAMDRSRRVRMELGQKMDHAVLSLDLGWIELLAGRPERAEPELRAAADTLQSRGGDNDVFGEWLRSSRKCCTSWDGTQRRRTGRGGASERFRTSRTGADPGRRCWPGAERRARRFASRPKQSSLPGASVPSWRSATPSAIGPRSLRLLGRPNEERPILEEALAVYERKGNLVSAARVREFLANL